MANDWRGFQEALLGALDGDRASSNIQVKEFKGSGDYLAFIDDGDPIYLPREIMDWMRARQEPESFIKKLMKKLS